MNNKDRALDENSGCACLKISYNPECIGAGLQRSKWTCNICGREFKPGKMFAKEPDNDRALIEQGRQDGLREAAEKDKTRDKLSDLLTRAMALIEDNKKEPQTDLEQFKSFFDGMGVELDEFEQHLMTSIKIGELQFTSGKLTFPRKGQA